METPMRGIRFRTQAAVLAMLASLLVVTRAEGQTRSWAQPQIARVVADGLMAPSVAEFRPDDALRSDELAQLLPALAPPVAVPPVVTVTTDTTGTDPGATTATATAASAPQPAHPEALVTLAQL